MDNAEQREAIARIVDPPSWRVLDSYKRSAQQSDKTGDKANLPYPERWQDRESLAKADATLALPTPNSPALAEVLEALRPFAATWNEWLSKREDAPETKTIQDFRRAAQVHAKYAEGE